MEIEKLFSENIAHAYIFSKSDSASTLAIIEKKFDLKFGSSQNAVLYAVENFGIEDSRAVTELGSLQSDGDTFVSIVARSIGAEAQHALLKTVEEPRRGVHYLLFVDNPEMLLPTLRSRCICVSKSDVATNGAAQQKTKHPDFLTIMLADRFAYIEKLAKNLKKDDPNAFRDAGMEIFDTVIDGLRNQIQEKTPGISISEKGDQLGKILALRNFLNDRGSSAKQLLETMAMQLE